MSSYWWMQQRWMTTVKVSTPLTTYKAGGVTERAEEWDKVTNNTWVKQMVRGVKLELTGMPYQTQNPVSRDKGNEGVLERKVTEMAEQGVSDRGG